MNPICLALLIESTDSMIVLFGQISNYKRNVWLKIVASWCDQCMWAVGVVAGNSCGVRN